MTFQTNFIATLDHVGTHVDAFRHVSPSGQPVDEMPLDLFMGKAVCFDLRHIADLGDITAPHMDEAEKKAGVEVNGHIVLLCTGCGSSSTDGTLGSDAGASAMSPVRPAAGLCRMTLCAALIAASISRRKTTVRGSNRAECAATASSNAEG